MSLKKTCNWVLIIAIAAILLLLSVVGLLTTSFTEVDLGVIPEAGASAQDMHYTIYYWDGSKTIVWKTFM